MGVLHQGPHREAPVAKEVLAEQQAAHIANLERLWEAGIAHLAGPLGDDGFLRGSVVLSAASREELLGHFGPDPFVQNGRLAIEAMRWSGSVERLGKPAEPPGMEQATLVVVRKGPDWAEDAALAPELLERLQTSGGLVLAGALEAGGDKVAVLLFRNPDAGAVTALLAGDPAVTAGRLVLETHPQYVGRGILGEDAPAAPPG